MYRGPINYTLFYIGLSTDVKPTTSVLLGSRFFEKDTENWYLFDSIDWHLMPASLIPHNNLLLKQGGTTDEYYHLTADKKQEVDYLHAPADGEITLTPKASSSSTAEGTMFYCSDDKKVYVGVDA